MDRDGSWLERLIEKDTQRRIWAELDEGIAQGGSSDAPEFVE